MAKLFYVYAYLRSKDSNTAKAGTPYYIGKGSGKRITSSQHVIKPPTDEYFIKILEKNLTEIGAYALERRLIQIWGRIDLKTGILHNKTASGPGVEGRIVTELTKMKRKKNYNPALHPCKRPEVRLKISLTKTGSKQTEESNKKRSYSMLGKNTSPKTLEHKKKISLTLTGRESKRKGITKSIYKFYNEDNEQFIVCGKNNFQIFCKTNGLGITSMNKVAANKIPQFKGWKVERIDQ